MYQILIGADEVQREDDGTAWTWKGGSVLVELNGKEFEQWIKDKNIPEYNNGCSNNDSNSRGLNWQL